MSEIPEQDRVELRPPPNMINAQFGRQWGIVTPAVYRYENSQWIDEFFETGKLRLSTFSKFATYPDEVRGDDQEGSGFCYGETSDGKSVIVTQRQGINATVLCCSQRLSRRLADDFQRDAVFQITNTMEFAAEVARQLLGFKGGIEGACIYRTMKAIKRKIEFDIEKYRLPDGKLDEQLLRHVCHSLGGPELVLLKRMRYQDQHEYRFMWEMDNVPADHIDVLIPGARKFCRKVKDEEWGE